jgi:hypothetical protein
MLVEPVLPEPPVVAVEPRLDKFLHAPAGYAIRGDVGVRLGSPPRASEPITQIRKVSVGDLDAKRAQLLSGVDHGLPGPFLLIGDGLHRGRSGQPDIDSESHDCSRL